MSEQIIQTEQQTPVVYKPAEDKIVINHMPVVIRSIDRSFKQIADWWNAIQAAENVYYPNRSDLYDIYELILKDGHLWGIIDKRIKNTVNKKLQFTVDGKKVEAIDELLKLKSFKSLRKKRFKKVTHGLCGFEFIPGSTFKYKEIPEKHISPERGLITTEQWGDRGFEYAGVWNIIVEGERGDFGILDKAAPYAIWKKGNMGDWAQYIEVFGQPMIIFTYDAHDQKTKAELDQIMNNIGSGSRLQVPKQVELKLEDGKQNNGNGELQDRLRKACNEEMSVIVLGVTETTTSSSSSGYAQSETQAYQQDEIIKDDMDEELMFFNSPEFLTILKSYGYPVEGGEFSYVDVIDAATQKGDLDIDKGLNDLGVPLDHDYYYDKYKRPKPKNYNQIIKDREKKQEAIQQGFEQKKTDKEGKKPGTKQTEDTKALTVLQRIQASLANFFDHAPHR